MGALGAFLRGPCWEYHFRYWAGVSKKPSWSGCKQPAGQSSAAVWLPHAVWFVRPSAVMEANEGSQGHNTAQTRSSQVWPQHSWSPR